MSVEVEGAFDPLDTDAVVRNELLDPDIALRRDLGAHTDASVPPSGLQNTL